MFDDKFKNIMIKKKVSNIVYYECVIGLTKKTIKLVLITEVLSAWLAFIVFECIWMEIYMKIWNMKYEIWKLRCISYLSFNTK
jgi:hypothetical protein